MKCAISKVTFRCAISDFIISTATDNQVGVVDLSSSRIIAKFSGHKQGKVELREQLHILGDT